MGQQCDENFQKRTKFFFGIISLSISLFLLITIYNNCSPSHKELTTDQDISSKGCITILEKAFQSGFYKWMRTKDDKKCSGCHVVGGGNHGKAPGHFADDDFDTAFSNFKSRVETIASHSKQEHHGAGVNDPNSQVVNDLKANYDEAQTRYNACMAQENNPDTTFAFQTVSKTMGLTTQVNPTEIRFKTITFSLETELIKGSPIAAAESDYRRRPCGREGG